MFSKDTCIDTGRLRHRVTIQKPNGTVDDHGQNVPSWTEVDTVWAEVRAVGGREVLRDQQVFAGIDSIVTIRHRTDIVPKWRVVHDSRNLNISRVADLTGNRVALELLCREDDG